MHKIVTVAQMRAIEQEGDASGVSYVQMMDNAGRSLADRVLDLLADSPPVKITVLVGSGNNGGDALVAGRLIAGESDHEVVFYLTKARTDDDPNYKAVNEAGLLVALAQDDQNFRALKQTLNTSQIVIDGILGIGLKLPIKGELARLLKTVNSTLQRLREDASTRAYVTPACPEYGRRAPWPYVIAVDCPSGLDCDTGELDSVAIHADETVTFAAAKIGQVLMPGAAACGTLHIADIGLPARLDALNTVSLEMPTAASVRQMLPTWPLDAHKGTRGKVMSVTGSLNFTGAASLAAEAAYRAGAGLVTVAAPQIIVPALAARLPEPTWLLLPHDLGVIAEEAAPLLRKEIASYSALLLGPGWGQEDATRDFLLAMLNEPEIEARHHRIGFAPVTDAQEAARPNPATDLPPLVIDADGLNLLASLERWWDYVPPNTILTPHPGEMVRLTGLSREEVNATRLTLPVEKAHEWGCVVVLKGAFTVIAAPDGRTAVLPFAEPALATAGTGDVLAGTITGLLAQGCEPFAAAVAGGYAHGLAGTLAARRLGTPRSVTARDVLAALPEAFSIIENAR
ncbi:MAG: bifunctional ADP-dependent NAD(P)H-hydrate dehydratase/NAD(P)H-hydrate epimerase [Anaerolineae bacterium]